MHAGGFDRTIVVGGIHGCYVALQEQCHLVNFGAQDALVTVGDFLDRGPGSWKVEAFFRDLPNTFSVLGNHERRVAGTTRGTSKPAWSQEQTLSLLPKEDWDHWACFVEQSWGAPRIHGELLKLGFEISERTVSRYIRRLSPSDQSRKLWTTFLRNHREAVTAMDFFAVPTLTFRVLYCFFVIEHGRRKILHFNVTEHPTGPFCPECLVSCRCL
jgi:hypothetical protein